MKKLDNFRNRLNVLKGSDRSRSVHIYDEEDITGIVERVFDMYIPAFEVFFNTMNEKSK